MIVGLFISAVGFGVIFAWTRSLFPAIIAHMIFDIPMTPIWQGVVVIAMIMCCLFIWRRALDILRRILATNRRAAYWTLALAGIVCAVAGTRVRGLEFAGLLLVILAIALKAIDLRSKSTRTEANTLAFRE